MVPMAARSFLVISCVAAASSFGCSGTSPSDTCIRGISIACPCAPGQYGVQTCTAAGAFAACVCLASADEDGGVAETNEAGSDVQVAPPGSDAQVTAPAPGSFTATGSMTVARDDFTATLLGNGKVLLAGGMGVGILASAELYDPLAGTFSATGSMAAARTGHTATLLPDGRVLIAGGAGDDGYGDTIASVELYDPLSGTFAAVGDMIASRLNHTATLLANGTVLIAAGTSIADQGETATTLASAELYDPLSGTFSPTGDMTAERSGHTATLLGNSAVLVVGGDSNGASAEVYDPSAGTFAATGSPTVARQNHTATLLDNGAVLIAGGSDGITALDSAESYDPATGSFAATAAMTLSRLAHTATLLRDGTVLMAGGDSGDARAEIYDPAAGRFTATGSMTLVRWSHTATLLADGAVLIAGGSGVVGYLASAQLYK